jgi:CubicO group peptidase (beta-lactamase class C family)
VLAEIVDRVTGEDYRDLVEERVTRPAGITRRVFAVPENEQGDVAPLQLCGEPATPGEISEALGIDEIPVGEVTDEALMGYNDPATRALGVPGAGGMMTAAELAGFYQVLLHDPAGIWKPDVLADATGHIRNELPDPLLGVPANRTLGLVVAGRDGRASLRGFGHCTSARAFGHNGAAGQIAWADPESGLSFAYLTNGIDRHQLRVPRRSAGISSRAAVC